MLFQHFKQSPKTSNCINSYGKEYEGEKKIKEKIVDVVYLRTIKIANSNNPYLRKRVKINTFESFNKDKVDE